MVVNEINFLRWDDAVPVTAQPALPHGYRRDRTGCGYMPVAYPTETMSFYINTALGMLFTGVTAAANVGLRLVRPDGTVVATGIGTVNLHTIGTNYNFYATFVVPAAATGIHYLEIYKVTGGTTILTSNYILVRNDKAVLDLETAYVRFRHDRIFYNTKYHELPGFYQQYRLHINVLERQLESEKESYIEQTTGKRRVLNNYLNRYHRVETYYFDDQAHSAAGIMFEHSYLEINGKEYSLKSTYKENSNPLSETSKGESEVYELAFGSANRC